MKVSWEQIKLSKVLGKVDFICLNVVEKCMSQCWDVDPQQTSSTCGNKIAKSCSLVLVPRAASCLHPIYTVSV